MNKRGPKHHSFSKALLDWHRTVGRVLPWKSSSDPYKIWLSEIILQQTRVSQGIPYYLKFIELYPTIQHLANASEDHLMKNWEGLGYYSRARNMHQTAKEIANRRKGQFPDSAKELVKLKGIGPYTAAAIASFVYGESIPVLDGNVYRVLSRFYDDPTPIDTTEGKMRFHHLANSVLDTLHPGAFNQAIMDLGALICLPKNPNCQKCPFIHHCRAYHKQNFHKLPVKQKKLKRKTRYFHYLLLQFDNQIVLQKRHQSDIWKSLYELPLIEKNSDYMIDHPSAWITGLNKNNSTFDIMSKAEQVLTHQKIICTFYQSKLINPVKWEENPQWIDETLLNQFAFPKIIRNFIDEVF